MTYKKVKSVFGWLIVAIVGYFFWRSLSRNWDKVQDISISFGPESVAVVVLFVLAVVMSGYLWGLVFRRVSGTSVALSDAVKTHIGAWILKYIPGQVGAFIYKLQWGKKHGVSKKVTTVAFAYEMLFLTLASTVVIIPILLATTGDATGSSLLSVYLLILAALVVFTRQRLNLAIIAFIKKVSGKKVGKGYLLRLSEIIRFTGWFTLPRIINAAGFVLLAAMVFDISPSSYVPLGAAYILAGIIGIYAIFVPSGLGVREAVIVAFASVYMSTEEAIVLSLLARLYATIADGVLGLIYAYISKQNGESSGKTIEGEVV